MSLLSSRLATTVQVPIITPIITTLAGHIADWRRASDAVSDCHPDCACRSSQDAALSRATAQIERIAKRILAKPPAGFDDLAARALVVNFLAADDYRHGARTLHNGWPAFELAAQIASLANLDGALLHPIPSTGGGIR